MPEKNALVLSGGNIKGAYQAGAIQAVLASGFKPDIVTGISVGALNAAFLAAFQDASNWPAVGQGLVSFWRSRVTKPRDVVKKRNVLELAYRILFKKWAGLVDTRPLADLLTKELGGALPASGPLDAAVGAVELNSGALSYTSSSSKLFLSAVLASSAEPGLMPLRKIGDRSYYDGGLRDIAPLKEAITRGATRIVAILCQPEHDAEVTVKIGDLMQLAEQVMGIVTNEIITNDLEVFAGVNELVKSLPAGTPTDKRYIPITIVRPASELGCSVTTFTSADIDRMIKQGQADAQAALK